MDVGYRAKIYKLSNWTLNMSAAFDDQELGRARLREEIRGLHESLSLRDQHVGKIEEENKVVASLPGHDSKERRGKTPDCPPLATASRSGAAEANGPAEGGAPTGSGGGGACA